jgi:ATP citrate (pro-S)-lyase
MELQFTYLEINPLVVTKTAVYILDLASRLDQTAEYLCASKWGNIEFPPPFGRDAYAEVTKQNPYKLNLIYFQLILGSLYC